LTAKTALSANDEDLFLQIPDCIDFVEVQVAEAHLKALTTTARQAQLCRVRMNRLQLWACLIATL
jgi:hypothetical protein